MAGNLFLMVFAGVTFFSRRLSKSALCLPLVAFLIYLTLLHTGSHALGRFSIPGAAVLIVLASAGLAGAGSFVRSRLNP